MYNEVITYYAKQAPNKQALEDYDIKHYEDNSICGDDLEVYLKISDGKITHFGFTGDTAIITTACASIFGESIIDMDLEEILTKDSLYIESLIEMPVSPRRKQASVLGLVTTRNAIHRYLNDGKKDEFEDVIVE
ncbi:iron-sulfur cluster assembly scaffold protein [Candidatus Gracilibacteria bacterium]|nr:iron-sulfur cluster assembly scaffold protein [Candidatus Gracilibacteria bacterium]